MNIKSNSMEFRDANGTNYNMEFRDAKGTVYNMTFRNEVKGTNYNMCGGLPVEKLEGRYGLPVVKLQGGVFSGNLVTDRRVPDGHVVTIAVQEFREGNGPQRIQRSSYKIENGCGKAL